MRWRVMLVAGCALHTLQIPQGEKQEKVEANAWRALRLFSANYWHIPSRTALLLPPPSFPSCCFPSVNPLNKCRSISLSVSARTARQSATKIPNVLRQRQKMNCPSGDKRCQEGREGKRPRRCCRENASTFFIEQLRLSDATRAVPPPAFPT